MKTTPLGLIDLEGCEITNIEEQHSRDEISSPLEFRIYNPSHKTIFMAETDVGVPIKASKEYRGNSNMYMTPFILKLIRGI